MKRTFNLPAKQNHQSTMIVVNTVEEGLYYLCQSYRIAKMTREQLGEKKACLVAGTLWGLTSRDWWYTLIDPYSDTERGLVKKSVFMELFRAYFIEKQEAKNAQITFYALNPICPIQELPRYKRQIDCWKEQTSKPNRNDDTIAVSDVRFES